MITGLDWLIVIAILGIGMLIPLVWFRFSVYYLYYLMRHTKRIGFDDIEISKWGER
jgi:hypothetical protein